MIPIRDDAPRSGFPYITLLLIGVNVVVFLFQFSLYLDSPRMASAFVETFGATPTRFTYALNRLNLQAAFLPFLTSMFLHGGWMHLIGNMWFLWIYGDNVEDELGHGTYLFFYLGCGILAGAAHFLSNPFSAVPAVGASGAIAGVMGGYLVRFPWARVTTLIPFIFFFTTVELPAALILVYWFAIQFFSGAASVGMEGGGVAWWAHIGGFVAGAALIWMRPRRRRLARRYDY